MATLHNETPAPGGITEVTAPADKEILFSYAGFTQKGVTLEGGHGIIPAGCALGRVTATKKWVPYDNGAANGVGSDVCRGILRDARDTGSGASSKDVLGNIVVAGMLKNDQLSGVDAGAITDLNARQDTVMNILQF